MDENSELSEYEQGEPNFEDKLAGVLSDTAKGLKGVYLSALFDVAKHWQRDLRHERKEGIDISPRKVGKNFDETFDGDGGDGVDGRIDTIALGEKDKAFVITDIHGEEDSMQLVLAKVMKALAESDDKVHLVSLGDFACYEGDESIEPMKAFLLLEALKKVDLSSEPAAENGGRKTLDATVRDSLLASGLPEESISNLLEKIRDNLEIHYMAGNGELYIPPTNQIAEQLGRDANPMANRKGEELFRGLPLCTMMRTQKRDIFAAHFLPPLISEKSWREDGLAGINDPNISELRVEAGVWGGYDKKITKESIAAKAEEAGEDPDELWALGRHNIGEVAGVRNLTDKRITNSGFPTFQRILSKKGRENGLYLFGHESALAASSGDRGYFMAEDDKDQAICFHSGGGPKVTKKIMMEINGNGDVKPIVLKEEKNA